MNYDEEIKFYQNKIDELNDLKSKEELKRCDNLVGLYLKPSHTSRYKIISMDMVCDDIAYCSVLNVFINTNDVVEINTCDYLDIQLPLDKNSIISEEEFNIFLNSAIELIKINK